MTWQENLFNNLLVVGILLALLVIIYLRIAGKTMVEFVKEIKEIFTPTEE